MYLAIYVLTLAFQFSGITVTAAVLKFDRQTPTELNNQTCGLVTCQHVLAQDDLSVQEVSLFNIHPSGPSRLVTVGAENCQNAKSDDVILLGRVFSRTNATVVLGVRNPNLCGDGEFMCEVIYVNGQLDKVTEVKIVRPNTAPSPLLPLDGLCKKINEMTSSIETLQNQLGNLTEYVRNTNICIAETVYPEGRLVFRGTSSIKVSVYEAYRTGAGIPLQVEQGCKQVGRPLPCSTHYRNDDVITNWKDISEVTFAIYKGDVKVKQIVFNGAGSSYMNWFDKSRVKDSSWTDLKSTTTNHFSIVGHQDTVLKRTFFINHYYSTCAVDVGWFVALDANSGGCQWEQNAGFPVFKYARGDSRANWNTAGVGLADYFAIFVK